jgi:hypothetical protein
VTKNYPLPMSEVPYLIIGFLLLGFVGFIIWSFNDDLRKGAKKDKQGSAKYRHKRSWWSEDH